MEKLCSHLYVYIKLYKIRLLNIIVHTKPNSAFLALVQQLTLKSIRIKGVYDCVRAAHNGVRKKNPRRK